MAGNDSVKTGIAVGLASGLGNCVYMLPAIKSLYLMGHDIALYIDTDFPTADLWRRCIYATEVFEKSSDPGGREAVAGEYLPPCWKQTRIVVRAPLRRPLDCVWRSNMLIARAYGFKDEIPDTSDWCEGLKRELRWDIGIVAGSKDGIWLRKRWEGMKDIALNFLERGRSVAVFGLEGDGIDQIAGDRCNTQGKIAELPDLLASCRVVISTDSGPGHLASSIGVPVVMVYTATSPVKAEPVNQPNRRIFPNISCHPCVSSARWFNCREWKCQKEIDPVRVVSAAENLLGERKP